MYMCNESDTIAVLDVVYVRIFVRLRPNNTVVLQLAGCEMSRATVNSVRMHNLHC